MDKNFIEKIREELVLTRDALISKIRVNENSIKDTHVESHGDSADLANDVDSVAKLKAVSGVDGNMLIGIENALRRIDEGKYGTCLMCNKEIPTARLEALPSAVLCLSCKAEQEARV